MKQKFHWRKSSYSGNQGNCVEVALRPSRVLVRDTKAREAGHIEMSTEAWRSLSERL